MKSIFEGLTNQYALSKTLRFELRPVLNTKQMLVDNKIIEEDGIRKEKYEKAKFYFNRLHREFTAEALNDIRFDDLHEYFSTFQVWQQNKKDKKSLETLQKKEKSLRQEITKKFNEHAKLWTDNQYAHLKLKNKSVELFFEEAVFSLLSDRYGSEEDAHVLNRETGEIITLFADWKGFTGYFKKFHETRRNFYKDDGTATAIATRIIDQNLRRFCDNSIVLERIREVIDYSEVEKNFGKSLDDIFSLDAYDGYVLQDGIDLYNRILGGETLKNGEKKRGINELVNKYRQDHKGEKLPFLKTLDKQILSEKEKLVFGIETDEECFDVLSIFYKNAAEKIALLKNLLDNFVSKNESFDLEKIYVSREALNTISHRWIDDGQVFEQSLFRVFKEAKDKSAEYQVEDEAFSFPDFIALDRVRLALEGSPNPKALWKSRYYVQEENESSFGFLSGDTSSWKQFLLILKNEFESLFTRVETDKVTGAEYVAGYDRSLLAIEQLLNSREQRLNSDEKVVIKNFADDVLRIYQIGKYFSLEKKRAWNTEYDLDSLFYVHPEMGYMRFHAHAYEMIVQKYNDLRNYLTKKPYSEKKWKLNFENSTLAAGWDKNKESDNSAVILRKDGRYYLGLMRKGYNKIFDQRNEGGLKNALENGSYEKMVYKLLPGADKMLPKVFFSASNIGFYLPSEKVLEIRNHSSHTKGGHPQKGFDKKDFNLADCQRLIDFFKQSIAKHPDWKEFDFHFSETSAYGDMSEFYHQVENGGYKVSFDEVSQSYIEKKNQDGELYLFEIYNQDFANGKRGKKNLHTMYWEALFSPENTDGFPMKLNGEADIFYRPATLKEKLGERRDAKGNVRVAHARYAENKIFFHCPITLNRGKGVSRYFNQKINDLLVDNPDINIIGVDRGEKHLAYYSVINQNQKILESGSLNKIGTVDYAEKLETKAMDREQARRDWQSVEGIKDLKKGYISQVVRRLADLAIEYNAIIVLEDLNMRFKQIRGGIEKSVYQQLEKALIDKLSFLVDKKEIDPKKAGHLLHAYQLAAPFESFQKMGKQTGILFYTQASYTSKIDPLTGWRPSLYLKYANAKKSQEDISKFSSIVFNEKENRFEFLYDVKFFQNLKEWPENTIWTACSCVERFRWNKTLNQNKGDYEHYIDVTENFKTLFEKFGIDSHVDIQKQIKALKIDGNEKFFRDFIFFWNLMCQIRNTDPSKKKDDPTGDFLLSPIEPFFDSRLSEVSKLGLPKNGDDNGAFNIARKGLCILEKIAAFKKKEGSLRNMKWGDLYISHSDWDTFAQRKRP